MPENEDQQQQSQQSRSGSATSAPISHDSNTGQYTIRISDTVMQTLVAALEASDQSKLSQEERKWLATFQAELQSASAH